MRNSFNRFSLIIGMALSVLVYSVGVFMFADLENTMLWIGYGGVILAFLIGSVAVWYSLRDPWNAKEYFYQIPITEVSFGYLVAAMVMGIVACFFTENGVKILVMLELLLHVGGIVVIGLAVMNMRKVLELQMTKADKVADMRAMASQVKDLVTLVDDAALAAKVNRLAEDFRFSDPMSNDEVAILDSELYQEIQALRNYVDANQWTQAEAQVKHLSRKLQDRNRECKISHGRK